MRKSLLCFSFLFLLAGCSQAPIREPSCYFGTVYFENPTEEQKMKALDLFANQVNQKVARQIAGRTPSSKFRILVVFSSGTQVYVNPIKNIIMNREPFTLLREYVDFIEIEGEPSRMNCQRFGRTVTCDGAEYLATLRMKHKAHRVLSLTDIGWGGTGNDSTSFTLGTQGLDPYVVVHEFYHTFGFADEYIEAYGDPDSRVYEGSVLYDRIESVCNRMENFQDYLNHFQLPEKIEKGRELGREHDLKWWSKLYKEIPWKDQLNSNEPIYDPKKKVFGHQVSYEEDRFGRKVKKNSLEKKIGLYRGGYCSLWRPGFIPFEKNTIMDSSYWVPKYYSEQIIGSIENEIGRKLEIDRSMLGNAESANASLTLPDGRVVEY